MYPQTLYPKTKQVLTTLKSLPLLKKFYLAGGTALSLQLGHRKSIDLDFFSAQFPDVEIIKQNLAPYHPVIIQEAPGTLDVLIDDVKVSFLEYRYSMLEPTTEYEGVPLASIIDIACMKISAVSSRGSKKDFIDLYKILQMTDLKAVLASFEKKFVEVKYQKAHLLKSLVYFFDAEDDPDPDYIDNIRWNEVKQALVVAVKNYIGGTQEL